MTDFIFFVSKITVNGDYNHETKTLAPWKKNYDELSILKSRDITASKGSYTQSYSFSGSHVEM